VVAAQPTAQPAGTVGAADEVPWWRSAPIATAVATTDGCRIEVSSAVDLSLTVDGSRAGNFLRHVWGATGELVLVPGGRSAARVTLGAAELDTGLDLGQVRVPLRVPPAPLGGILHVDERATFHVVGGNARRLALELATDGAIEWLVPTRFEVPCEALQGAPRRWPDPPGWNYDVPVVYPTRPLVTLRAREDGRAIARMSLDDGVELERRHSSVKVMARLSDLGLVVGWSDAGDWAERSTFELGGLRASDGPAGAVVGWEIVPLSCAPGTPLFVLRRNRVYRVGQLATAPGPRAAEDWRFSGGRIRLPARPRRGSAPWFVLDDDFLVSNRYGHAGVEGELVVPESPAACALEPGPAP
jgi:hypothetical protein